MSASGGQLCARARFWASLRIDGELSELEAALLVAHLARCEDCAAFAAGAEGSTAALRAVPLASHTPVSIARQPASPRRVLAGIAAAAVVIGAALLGGIVGGSRSTEAGSLLSPGRSVSAIADVDTPDQLRRLRRTALLDARPLPRELSAELS